MAKCGTQAVLTRNKTEIWLIGQVASQFNQTKLPTIREALSVLFHYKQEQNQTIKESTYSTVNDILLIWDKARIPTRQKIHVVQKLEKIFNEWQNLKKNKENKAKRSESLKQRETQWQDKIDALFDIAHANALDMIRIDEDRQFLIAQRQAGRPGKMGSVDKKLAKKETEIELKKARLELRRKKELQDIKTMIDKIPAEDNLTDSDTDSETEPPETTVTCMPGPSSNSLPKKRGRKQIVGEKLAVSLDVTKLSDRNAALVLTSTIKELGCDPADYSVNYSSIRRQRIKTRQSLAENLKKEFSPDVPLTVHWDGKMLEDISGHTVVDRLPILVSGENVDQLLSVPKLESGSGELTATAVYDTVLSWGLSDKVKSLCFDTTAVNTGSRNGACVLIEQKFDKEMLWLACRHHVLEIMLETIVVSGLGPSTGPEILLFKRFKNVWSEMKLQDFQSVKTDPLGYGIVKNLAPEIVAFSKDQLKQYQPRDDYRELLELSIMFLGDVPEKGVSFKAPGGMHRARWMAKAIYSLKIYLFRGQFNITKREEHGIRDICIFTVVIYIKNWFQSAVANYAPLNDLNLLKDLVNYKTVNEIFADKALKKIKNHLWYLSETLVGLAFFDERVSDETKTQMVSALQNDGQEHLKKRTTVDLEVISTKRLDNFVSSNTMDFFRTLELDTTFLTNPVQTWEQDEVFKKNKATVKSLRVVNDIAERGVALIEEFNKLITAQEEQKQFLLLVVKNFRKQFPDRNKQTLIKM